MNAEEAAATEAVEEAQAMAHAAIFIEEAITTAVEWGKAIANSVLMQKI